MPLRRCLLALALAGCGGTHTAVAVAPPSSPSPSPPAAPSAAQPTALLLVHTLFCGMVRIDGREMGRPQGVAMYGVSPGSHRVAIDPEGAMCWGRPMEPVEQTIDATDGEMTSVHINLPCRLRCNWQNLVDVPYPTCVDRCRGDITCLLNCGTGTGLYEYDTADPPPIRRASAVELVEQAFSAGIARCGAAATLGPATTVTFGNDGDVAHVEVADGTAPEAADCLREIFTRSRITAFEGAPLVVHDGLIR